jgi:hypothetical protein
MVLQIGEDTAPSSDDLERQAATLRIGSTHTVNGFVNPTKPSSIGFALDQFIVIF